MNPGAESAACAGTRGWCTPPSGRTPRSTPRSWSRTDCAPRPTTPAAPRPSARASTSSSWTASWTWWWPPRPSAWGSTSPTSASWSTRTSPSPWTATTRSSAAPGGTASLRPAVLHYRAEDLGLRRFFGSHSRTRSGCWPSVTVLRDAGGPVLGRRWRRHRHPGPHPHRVAQPAAGNRAVKVGKRGVRLAPARSCPGGGAPPSSSPRRGSAWTSSRIEMMRGYAETDGCRRQFLLGYFGEDLPEPCGNCDTCEDGSAAPAPCGGARRRRCRGRRPSRSR